MRVEKAAAILLGCSLFAASSGMTSAYLKSDPRILKNAVSVGSVSVELTEPAWQPENAQNLTPAGSVPKNPTVTNTGRNDAWIFLRLSVSAKHIFAVDRESGRKLPAADTELFSFAAKESWELIERTEGENAVEYVYGYKKLVKPSEATEPLFERVELVNYLEGDLTADETLHINIRAAAIQDHVCPPGAGLSEIYQHVRT